MVLGLTVRNFCYSVQEILAQPSRRLKLLRGQTHRSLPGLRAGPPLTLSAHPQPSSQMGLRSTLWIVVRRQSSAVNLCGASPSGRKPVSSRQSIDTQRHPLSPKGRGLFPPPQFLFLYKWKKRRVLSPLASQNAVPLATRSGRFQSRDRRKGQYHLETRHGSPRTAGAQPDETLRPEEPLLSPLSSGRTAEGVEWFVRI